MFGYVMIDKPELKVKEFYRYKAYYCGLFRDQGGGVSLSPASCEENPHAAK